MRFVDPDGMYGFESSGHQKADAESANDEQLQSTDLKCQILRAIQELEETHAGDGGSGDNDPQLVGCENNGDTKIFKKDVGMCGITDIVYGDFITPSADFDGSSETYKVGGGGLEKNEEKGGILKIHGKKIKQGKHDVHPGTYYVSQTAFSRGKAIKSTSNYLDATKVAYLALSTDQMNAYGAKLGDIVRISNSSDPTKFVWGIIGDVGNSGEFKEVSAYALNQIGITVTSGSSVPDNAKINIEIYTNTGFTNGFPVTQQLIESAANDMLSPY